MNLTRRRFIQSLGIASLALYLRIAPEKVAMAAERVAPKPTIESRELSKVLAQLLAAGRDIDIYDSVPWEEIRKWPEAKIGDWIFASRQTNVSPLRYV